MLSLVFVVLNPKVEIAQVDDDDIDPETQRAANELNAQLIADLEATRKMQVQLSNTTEYTFKLARRAEKPGTGVWIVPPCVPGAHSLPQCLPRIFG